MYHADLYSIFEFSPFWPPVALHRKKMRSNNSRTPCVACRNQKRKCTDDCIFANHLINIQQEEFDCMHRIYGISNKEKILIDVPVEKRDDCIRSILHEARMRKEDPVYGSTRIVIDLENKAEILKKKLHIFQERQLELEKYILTDQSPLFGGQQTSPSSIFSDPVTGNGVGGGYFTHLLHAEASVSDMNSLGQLDLNVPSSANLSNAEANAANLNSCGQLDLNVANNEE